MASALLLTKVPLSQIAPRVAAALGSANLREVVVVAPDNQANRDCVLRGDARGFGASVLVEDYAAATTEQCAVAAGRRSHIGAVISLAERDIPRAARIREALGLPGQSLAAATAFTNKHVMKSMVAAGGVPVPAMTVADRSDAVWRFTEEWGFPVVLKPVTGGGSAGVEVLASAQELAPRLSRGITFPVLVERFIDGDFYHVDGLMREGEVLVAWPSAYLHPNLETLSHSRPLSTGLMHPDEPVAPRLQEVTARVVATLPSAPHTMPFHAEFFHTRDDRLVLCEIASRAAGASLVETFRLSMGVDLTVESIRGQSGMCRPFPRTEREPGGRYGFAWIPPRPGVLNAVPDLTAEPGVVRYTVLGKAGCRYEAPKSLSDMVAQLVFRLNGQDTREELGEWADRWLQQVRWETQTVAQGDMRWQ